MTTKNPSKVGRKGKVLQNKSSQKKTKQQKQNRTTMSVGRSAPVSLNFKSRTGDPNIRVNGKRTTVKHTEFFSDLALSVGPVLPNVNQTEYLAQLISPANAGIFPWLSQISPNYETYKFKRLDFKYVAYAPTTAQGVVILAVDYDPGDPAPATKGELMAMEESVRTPCWSTCTHQCRKSNLLRHGIDKYTDLQFGSTPSPQAVLRQQCVGTFYAAGMNGTLNTNVGELYVDYEIEFETPQLGKALAPQYYSSITYAGGPFAFSPASLLAGSRWQSNFPVSFPNVTTVSIDSSNSNQYFLLTSQVTINIATTGPLTGLPTWVFGTNFVNVALVQSAIKTDGSASMTQYLVQISGGANCQALAPLGLGGGIPINWEVMIEPASFDQFANWIYIAYP